MTIGEQLKAIRLKKHLTQQQLADRCGMIDSSIRRYESNRLTPKPATLRRLAAAMDVSITEFFNFSSKDSEVILRTEKILSRATEELHVAEGKKSTPEHISTMKQAILHCEETLDGYIASAKLKLQAEKAQKEAEEVHAKEQAQKASIKALLDGQSKDKDAEMLLSIYYSKLNNVGKRIALERLEELAQIPAYSVSKKSND